MTLSQRLTRAGLTFILLGTVALVLPQQDNAATADVTCTANTNYVIRISKSGTSMAGTPFTIPSSGSSFITNISTDGGTTFNPANGTNFPGRSLIYYFSNDASSGGTITVAGNSVMLNPGANTSYTVPAGNSSTGLSRAATNPSSVTGSGQATFVYNNITLTDSRTLLGSG